MIAPLLAAIVSVTPATVQAQVVKAGPGATVRLDAGPYGRIFIHNRKAPLVVDAATATINNMDIVNSSNVEVDGGTFSGAVYVGFTVRGSDHIALRGGHYVNSGPSAISVFRSSDVVIAGNSIRGSTSDGIDIAASQRVLIERNDCADIHPAPGAHPDCVQLWSPGMGPQTTDVTIQNNISVGHSQGFTAIDHPEVGALGYSRVIIRRNVVVADYPPGIVLYNCADCEMSDNTAATLPHSKYRANIYVSGGHNVVARRNSVGASPGRLDALCRRDTHDALDHGRRSHPEDQDAHPERGSPALDWVACVGTQPKENADSIQQPPALSPKEGRGTSPVAQPRPPA